MESDIPLGDARAKLSELVGRAEDHHERIVITVHGEPTAFLLSVYDYESMIETLDVLGDPGTLADLAQSEQELADGLDSPIPPTR